MVRRYRMIRPCFFGVLLVVLIVLPILIHVIIVGQVDAQLGFGYATPYVAGSVFKSSHREIFLVTRADRGKPLHDAGLRKGDIIMFNSVDTLYHLLVFNQGRQVTIPIERNRQRMTVRVAVPRLKLWFPPQMTFWLKESDKRN